MTSEEMSKWAAVTRGLLMPPQVRNQLYALVDQMLHDRRPIEDDRHRRLRRFAHEMAINNWAAKGLGVSPAAVPEVRVGSLNIVVDKMEQQVNVQMPAVTAAPRKVQFETDEDGNPVSAVITTEQPATTGVAPNA